MWVTFLKDFTWTPPEKRQVHIAYKAGMTLFVRKYCAADAIAAGAAEPFTKKENENGT